MHDYDCVVVFLIKQMVSCYRCSRVDLTLKEQTLKGMFELVLDSLPIRKTTASPQIHLLALEHRIEVSQIAQVTLR